jgi:hypothetical protein
VQRIPWWHGKPVRPVPNRGSLVAVTIALVALVAVIVAAVVVVFGGPHDVLGVAMLVAMVALPTAVSLHRRQG